MVKLSKAFLKRRDIVEFKGRLDSYQLDGLTLADLVGRYGDIAKLQLGYEWGWGDCGEKEYYLEFNVSREENDEEYNARIEAETKRLKAEEIRKTEARKDAEVKARLKEAKERKLLAELKAKYEGDNEKGA